MPPMNTYDTEEEQLVSSVMSALCAHKDEFDKARKIVGVEFEARAIELKHFRDTQCFQLLVKSAEDGVFYHKEGDMCQVTLRGMEGIVDSVVPSYSLRGVERIVDSVVDDSTNVQKLDCITICGNRYRN